MTPMKIVPFRIFLLSLLSFGLILTILASAQTAHAQRQSMFKASVRVLDTVTLISGEQKIKLWGVEKIESAPAVIQLKGRTELANTITNNNVQCEIKDRNAQHVLAQCVNEADMDLGLLMIQKGFVAVDRAAVYDTVYERPYVQAENQAQNRHVGIWKESASSGGLDLNENNIILGISILALLIMVVALGLISSTIMRGFRNIMDAQKDAIEIAMRERRTRLKERGIVAAMLEAELKTNKSKIEAYLVVYEEMLNDLKNVERAPRFKTAGDIVQKQPALGRTIFDRNADKLDVLGQKLASELIHFYARIKSNAEYANLEPEMSVEDASQIIEHALENAKNLNQLADELITSFEDSGIAEEVS